PVWVSEDGFCPPTGRIVRPPRWVPVVRPRFSLRAARPPVVLLRPGSGHPGKRRFVMKRSEKSSRTPADVQVMESRVLLSGTPAPAPAPTASAKLERHVLVVRGVDAKDSINVSLSSDKSKVLVNLNGKALSFAKSDLRAIWVDARG